MSPAAPVPPSRRPVARLRRALWRWRHLLLVSTLAVAGWLGLQELRPPAPPSASVVVLAGELPAGSVLDRADLALADLPPALAGPEMMRSVDDAVGAHLAVGLPAGFPLTDRVLVGPGLAAGAPAGEVVVPVRLADDAVARLLRPGDRVDLLAATADTAAAAGNAEVVAAGALVMARYEEGSGGLISGAPSAPLVLVALPRAAAAGVVGASAWAPLRVVLP